jgi:hypothetical protein
MIEGIHYKIYDNFLPEDAHNIISTNLLSANFPWYYRDSILATSYHTTSIKSIDDFAFAHVFYDNNTQNSQLFSILDPILKKINPLSILRIKANLYPRTETIVEHDYHTDYENVKFKTAMYYVNDNNGKTIFKDGLIVDSVANRFVEFDTDILHKSTTCTDQRVRCNINFNYVPYPKKAVLQEE